MSRGNDQAFPCPDSSESAGSWGMTMREWYAGQALKGLLASPNFNLAANHDMAVDIPITSRIAFEYADAMIAESQKKPVDPT